jgi:pimeloyl-ACP methyl ester carboxylesterase
MKKKLILLPCLLGLSTLFFTSCEKERNYLNPVQEAMVDVNGYQLFTRTSGNKPPKVVLITGIGGSTLDWSSMEDEFATVATVINYDREGLGRSPWQKHAKDSETIADELHSLLQAKGIPPPYILVSHSLGGFYARAFTERFNQEVEGMVLVDPTPENLIDSIIATLPLDKQVEAWEIIRKEETQAINQLPEGGLKEEVKAINILYEQARNFNSTTEVPIAIISSMRLGPNDSQISKDIAKKQRDQLLMQMSTGPNKHYVTYNSGHFVQKDQPSLVMEALNWVLLNI